MLINESYNINLTITDIDIVDIYISRDSGTTWEIIELEVPVSHYTSEDEEVYVDFNYTWIVKGPRSLFCKVKVVGSGDFSNIVWISDLFNISDFEERMTTSDFVYYFKPSLLTHR